MKYEKGLVEARIYLFVFENFRESLPEDKFKLVREIFSLAREIEDDFALVDFSEEEKPRDGQKSHCGYSQPLNRLRVYGGGL